MSTLDHALAWARRGFRVFPLATGSKQPLWKGWTELASTDEQTIRGWWTSLHVQHEYNVGVLTTGLTVLDADVKGGRPGLHSYQELNCPAEVLTVATPSGGYHFYFQDAQAPNAVQLLPGLDIRAAGGFVIAPGSVIAPGGPDTPGEYRLYFDGPVATLPENAKLLLRARRERAATAVSASELDTPSALTAGLHFLQHSAPLAIEGSGGDDTTYRVACRLRDFGVSDTTAAALMREHWNLRCIPPWDPEELQRKVENAFLYATGAAGQSTAEATFNGLTFEAAPPIEDEPADEEEWAFGNALPQAQLRRRPWVLTGILMKRSVTTLISPGGIGKSTLMLAIAAHLAVGRNFLDFECRVPGKSVIYNAEDDLEEQTKRLIAVCQLYGFDYAKVSNSVLLLTPEHIDLHLTRPDPENRFSVVVDAEQCQRLGRFCANLDVVFVGIDPLIEVFGGDVNDNAIQMVNMSIARGLARASDIALMIAHHTRKPTGSSPMAGDAAASMGASAIINSARLNLTLVSATAQDCERYAIRPEDRLDFLRIDSAKGNYVRRNGEPIWLRRHSVDVLCGDGFTDGVGVLRAHDLREDLAGAAMQMARTLSAEMRAEGRASFTLTEAVQKMMALDPLCEKLTLAQVKVRIENLLTRPVTLESNARVMVKTESGKKVVALD